MEFIKVYTVKVDEIKPPYKRWYSSKQGEIYNAVLISKNTNSGDTMPVFLVVTVFKGKILTPQTYLTISQVHCTVVEENIYPKQQTLGTLIRNFSKVA